MTTSIYTIDGPLPRLVRSRWISTIKKQKKNEEREKREFWDKYEKKNEDKRRKESM
jgi:hypothetical protein